MTSAFALSPIRHQRFSSSRDQSRFLVVAALLIAVLIADAVLIALAAPNITDIASLYTATT
jgi:hypothetical protein